MKDLNLDECTCGHIRKVHSITNGCLVDDYEVSDSFLYPIGVKVKDIIQHYKGNRYSLTYCYCEEYEKKDMFKKCIEEILSDEIL